MFSGLFLYLISPHLNTFSCESVLRIFTAFNDSVAQGVNEHAPGEEPNRCPSANLFLRNNEIPSNTA